MSITEEGIYNGQRQMLMKEVERQENYILTLIQGQVEAMRSMADGYARLGEAMTRNTEATTKLIEAASKLIENMGKEEVRVAGVSPEQAEEILRCVRERQEAREREEQP